MWVENSHARCRAGENLEIISKDYLLLYIVILCENKTKANERLKLLTTFLEDNLKLTFNSKTRIFKDSQGVNFCGYKINENRLKIRNSSKYRMKRKLKVYTKQLKPEFYSKIMEIRTWISWYD